MLNPNNFWPSRNFAALDASQSAFERARYVVLPAPYDATTTWRGGTRGGPEAIIAASMNMELWERELGREVGEVGIHTAPDIEPLMSGPELMAARIEEVVGEVLDARKIPVLLGGEHSLSLGGIRALAARSERLTVVQIDAHTDLRDEYAGTRFGHGCVMRRVSELPNVAVVQIGLRSTSREEAEEVPANVTQFWADDVLPDFGAHLPAILAGVSGDVYLTFDVDGCDPSWMPDTGTPEPGGLSWYQVRDLFRALCGKGDVRVRALDCVELIGEQPASAFAVARLLYKVMGYLSAR